MGHITKNYTDNNGDRTVIGGELALIGDGIITKDGVPVDFGGGSGGGGPEAATVAPKDLAAAAAVGASAKYAREDHVHKLPAIPAASTTAGAALAAAGAAGTAATFARGDHTHPFPSAANVGAIAKSAVASLTAIADPAAATAEQVATAYNNLLAALKA